MPNSDIVCEGKELRTVILFTMESQSYGDECDEERFKKYLERKNKLREIYEDQIVAEKSLSEILARKRRIKLDALMRKESKERKLRSGLNPLHGVEGVTLPESHLRDSGFWTDDGFEETLLSEAPLGESALWTVDGSLPGSPSGHSNLDDGFEGSPIPQTPLGESRLWTAIPRESLFKNRLQEYAQKAAIPLPSYHTINEGSDHAPQFRSKVVLDGATYTSPNVFSHRKAAEMDVAEIALLSLTPNMRFLSSDHSRPHIREDSCSLDQEDTISCKQVLNEFAVKINVQNPIYITEKADGPQPMFVSSLIFNGKNYVGDKGRNKKESQQLVARTAILSILDSDAHTVISKIINSKKMLSAAKKKVKVPVGMYTESTVGISASKQNELNVVMVDDNMPRTAIPEPCTGNSSNVAAKLVPLHQFRLPKKEALPDKGNATPIIFVPPECEQLVASTSVKKRKRMPKKVKNEAGIDVQYYIILP